MSQTNPGRTSMVDGRIVWVVGNLFTGRKKTDMNTRQPVIDQKTGEQVIEYGFGLAVEKRLLNMPDALDPQKPGVWQQMMAEAMTLYPNGQIPPSFAMKYSDGDGVDHTGKPFNQREGHAGCIVLKCTTRIPIKYFKFENGTNTLLDAATGGIKCGDYVRVQLQIKAHPGAGTAKAGLYLNPGAVQLIGVGAEIINTPSGDDIFGTAQAAVPQGATAPGAMPVVSAPFPGMPMPAQPPAAVNPVPGYPQQPVAPPQAAPQMPPPAHHAVLPQQFQPPPGGMPAPGYPATAPAPVYQPPYQPVTAPPMQPQFPQAVAAPAPQGMPMPGAPQGFYQPR